MELSTQNRSVKKIKTALDTVAEQLVDLDLTLPDYCPDIEKILKCSLTPKIQTKTLSGGQLQVDGYCVVNVLYVDASNKSLRCCEQSVNFSQSFSVSDTPEDFVVMTKTKPEYINCRALSPRRLVLRGAFSLYARVLGVDEIPLYKPDNESLEVLRKTLNCADLKVLCQEQFNVSEEISVADKPAIESVLYSDVTAIITDSKAVTGKLMINGEINLRMLYISDLSSGQTEKIDYVLPFSQVIDCEGISEETNNIISCEIMSYDLRLKNDMMSEKPSIVLDVKLCVTEKGYLPQDIEVVADAFSTEFASKPEYKTLNVISEITPCEENCIEKLSVKVDNEKITKIIDIYCDGITLDTAITDDRLNASGKINICMLAENENGLPFMVERGFEYHRPLSSAGNCDRLYFRKADVASVSYRLADENTAEIRCELKISGGAVKQISNNVVQSVDVFEDMPREKDDCALVLYFAGTDESMWEIAKAHNIRLEALMSENSAESETLAEPTMLLIPKI